MVRRDRSASKVAGRRPVSRSSKTSGSVPAIDGLWWRAGLIVIAGTATYWNSLSGSFILDDQLSVLYNTHIRRLWPPASLLFADQDSPSAGRPLVNVSLAINYAIGGLQVRGYHVWNLAVHLLCALLVFGIVRRTFELPGLRPRFGQRSIALGFATAFIWMLHPLTSEVVDYVTQRSESMMALFFLLTLYSSIRARDSFRVTAWQAMAVVSCGLGMTCKESMVTAPLVVILYDRVFVFDSLRQALRARRSFYAGLAAMWLVLAALVSTSPRGTSAGFSSGVSPWTYLLNQTVMITQYLHLTIWPRSLVGLYGWPLPLTLGEVMLPASLVVCLLLVSVATLMLKPELGFLGAWFFITLAPTSSVVPIATEVGAERRMYLPLIAAVLLAVIGSRWLWDLVTRSGLGRGSPITRAWSYGWAFTLAVVSVALAARTVVRNREYATPLSLARTVVERWPTSAGYTLLGSTLIAAGHPEEAEAHLRAAMSGAPLARYDLGVVLFNEGRLEESIEQLDAFVRIWMSPPAQHPFWQPPLRNDVISAREIMGRAFARLQRWPEAAVQFRQVVTMAPQQAEARHSLADALFSQKMFDEASMHYAAYLELRPDNGPALANWGIALLATDKIEEALLAFRRAAAVAPTDGQAQRNLANALFDHGDVAEAAVHAREAVRLRPNDAEAHDLLGRALARQGKLEEAATQFERALQIDPAYADAREHLGTIRRVRRN